MCSYSPAGLTSELRVPAGCHAAPTLISVITSQGLMRFSCFDGAIDTERFISFLEDLIKDRGRKVFLIVDNLRVPPNGVAKSSNQIELLGKARRVWTGNPCNAIIPRLRSWPAPLAPPFKVSTEKHDVRSSSQ